MSAPSHEALAQRLRDAYVSGPIAPMRDGLSPTDGDGAYDVQAINTRHWVAQGRRIVGRKIGLTAKVVQAQLGVDQPDFGVLFDDMRIPSGGVLNPAKVLQPKAEAEVALVMAHDLEKADATAEDLAACVRHVLPAIEIVDSRLADWKITFADTVADNGSAAFFVLGDEPKPLDGLDLWTCGMALEINGAVVSLGAGVACLGHPLNAAAWLARTLTLRGEPLKAGDILMTGALGPMAGIQPGDQVRASIGGLGSVTFSYGDVK
jgi:2-keto-4-pentenoate hydratase